MIKKIKTKVVNIIRTKFNVYDPFTIVSLGILILLLIDMLGIW